MDLDAGPLAPFSIRYPAGPETPVLVEVPHAGLRVTAPELASLIAPARSLAADADLFVDELFGDAPAEGATLITAHVSRYVCDLNRSEADVDVRAADGGAARNSPHGLVWLATTDGAAALARPLRREELERRLRDVYRPYHAAIEHILAQKRERFGFAILLCAHSMPSRGRGPESSRERADIVPGSRGRTTAAGAVIDCLDRHALATRLTVTHDDPYRGGYSTAHYGKPSENLHALQIEIARRLYLDERSLEKIHGKFEGLRSFCRTLVARLGSLKLGSATALDGPR